MRIASHNRRGHPLAQDVGYVPVCAWPADCAVQWGGNGIVLSENSYRTAFFEAFPNDNAGGFLRGEGSTLEAAERNCFARYQEESACNHRWGRKGYTNGGALCHSCGAFTTKVFKPVVPLDKLRRPLEWFEDDTLGISKLERIESGRAMLRLLRIRKRLFGVKPSARSDA